MEALAKAHDGSVQMIDTSIVRVHQHGGCAGGGGLKASGMAGPTALCDIYFFDCPRTSFASWRHVSNST
jgi:hypothetical protein